MAAALALLSSLIWGVSDFLGGFASRRASPLRVMVVATPAGAVLLFAIAPLIDGQLTTEAIWWGIAAGTAGSLGMGLLYQALAMGPMGIVSPLTAVISAAVPVFAGLLDGERPGVLAWIGIALAGVAITLVSAEPPADEGHNTLSRAGLLISIASGITIGLFLTLIARAPDDSGLWSVAFARVTSTLLILAVAAAVWTISQERWANAGSASPAAEPKYWPPADVAGIAVAVGILDAIANSLYLIATRSGLLSIIAVLAALYPATTVLLARFVLHERLRPIQRVGMVTALVAAGLLAVGG
jgi:drug/metabolite transporter (DMT)-like permease